MMTTRWQHEGMIRYDMAEMCENKKYTKAELSSLHANQAVQCEVSVIFMTLRINRKEYCVAYNLVCM